MNKIPISQKKFNPKDPIYIASKINSVNIRNTDSSSTLDHFLNHIRRTREIMKGISSLDMFEILIRLDKTGLRCMKEHFFWNWNRDHIKTWEWRNLELTLNKLIEL